DAVVVSRAGSLDLLAPETLRRFRSTFIVSTVAGLDDGDATEDGVPAPLLNDLHAKLIVIERGRRAHVFVGSANATDAALTRNIEVLVELTGGKKARGVATLLDPESAFLGMLEPYDTEGGADPDPDTEAQWRLENALRDLASCGWVVSVQRSGDKYVLGLDTQNAASIPPGMSARVEPLAHPGKA